MVHDMSTYKVISLVIILLIVILISYRFVFKSKNGNDSVSIEILSISPANSNSGDSLEGYFKFKSSDSPSGGFQSKKKKDVGCEINGQTVKAGTVISGETCIPN